ncbi:hypothetical protein [Streptomyces crystallinus]|uniref:Uncharacterized protein n=1 Tax=Streptomyces crystallinus TaxID=68191 RepID=A0ABN1FP22_9ACTN
MTETPNDTYIDLSGLGLTTSYLLPSGSPMPAAVHGVNLALPKPLWVSIGAGGPEYLDAALLFGLRQGGRLVLGGAVTGAPVVAAVRQIALERIAATLQQNLAQQTPPSTSTSSTDEVDVEEKPSGRGRWEDSDEEATAAPPPRQQPVRQTPAARPPQQQAPRGPTAQEIGARMAPGQRFVTPRGRACHFSERGDSAVRHFGEYLASRKEQTAVFFSNVRRYSPLEYWETLLAMCDTAIDLHAMGAARDGQNCVVMDADGRPWTIGIVQAEREYRLTHAHFENYQNS